MFGIGGAEIAVIAVVALLLFGPDKIPQMLKTFKKAVGFYAEARDQVQEVVSTQIISPEELEMLKDPLGLGGKNPAQALLTPERKSLYEPSSEREVQVQQQSAPAAESIWASLESPAASEDKKDS